MIMSRSVFIVLVMISVTATAVGLFVQEINETCVTVQAGTICGTKIRTRCDRSIYAFKGIPYAKPPTGERRFKEPEPVDPWTGRLDTKVDAPICIQKDYLVQNPTVKGQEDCLFLNVYTPQIPDSNRWARNDVKENHSLPVMVYIHGGGWFAGSGASYLHGPEFILDEDVVLVTFNYRLGVFGFLSTEDDSAPGNWAMKDMVLVLNWVKDNIKTFNGNPDSVTIFGESAGGASVHYLMLSPSAQGLFHRAISQSGSALNIWATPINSNQIARLQATYVDCPANNTSDILLNCLRTTDANKLVETGDKFKFWSIEPLTIYIPSIEKETTLNKNPFITDTPLNLIQKGKFNSVPYMIGSVANEGLIRAAPIITQPNLREELNKRWNELGPAVFGISRSVPEEQVSRLWENITDFYMKEKYINHSDPNNIQNYIDMYGDRAFIYGIYKSAVSHANKDEAPVYFYKFNYAGTYTWSDVFAATDKPHNYSFSISHCDDLLYLFRIPALFPDLPQHGTDVDMSKQIIKLWTKFAKDGKPAKNWNRVPGHGKVQYLDLASPTELNMKQKFLHKRMQFWENLDIEENR